MVIFMESKNFSPHLCVMAGTGAPIQFVNAA